MGARRRHDVHVDFEERPLHADGVRHTLLAIQCKSLGNRVDDFAVRREVHGLGAFDRLIDVIGGDFLIGAGDVERAVIVEGLKMVAADGDGDVFHHLLGRVFGFFADPGDGAGRFIDVDDDAALQASEAGASRPA